ncbi:hypothetical protein [Aureliella helgolandensis]|uniref:hypothetical protein n=1 Tax=Aureliella helgolandensis TaxID=2527968 RepID=UPI00119D44F4|nr:hypothetical protein [Aureliella helgolandensis]
MSGRYVDVITDMELTDSLRELPRVLDAAVPIWCSEFGISESTVADWHLEAFIMKSRERFEAARLIPNDIPHFPHGFQWGNQIWVTEQATEYYRRHLFLHEGTHWFMNRKYRENGPPWLMEGLAEWYGTHTWDGTELRMGIIPASKLQVPGWGRISLIQEQMQGGIAPSLETIMRYDTRAHSQAEAYAWSWAAIVLFKHHPEVKRTFDLLLKQQMQPDATLTRWFFRRVGARRWAALRQSWNAMLTEVAYGFAPSVDLLVFSQDPISLNTSAQALTIDSTLGWQGSGLLVSAGTRVQLSATGECIIRGMPTGATDPESISVHKPWICQPQGVTLEYHHGQPLGQLQMTTAAPLPTEPDFAEPLTAIPIGRGGTFVLPIDGELFFRVNESSGARTDNSGKFDIRIYKDIGR